MHNLFLRIQLSDKLFKTLNIVIQPSTSHEHDILDPSLSLIDLPEMELSLICNPEFGKTVIIIDDFDLTKLNKVQQQR